MPIGKDYSVPVHSDSEAALLEFKTSRDLTNSNSSQLGLLHSKGTPWKRSFFGEKRKRNRLRA